MLCTVQKTDVEKVIQGIECCRFGFCNFCPYRNVGEKSAVECRKQNVLDALEVLQSIEWQEDDTYTRICS